MLLAKCFLSRQSTSHTGRAGSKHRIFALSYAHGWLHSPTGSTRLSPERACSRITYWPILPVELDREVLRICPVCASSAAVVWPDREVDDSCADTDEWLARESQPERRAIIAHQPIDDPHISDPMSVGLVGGGGRWQLNIVSDGRMDVWEAKWEVGDRTAPDRRIWRVSYASVAENASAATANLEPLGAVISTLRQTISDVLAFCKDHR